MKRLLVITNTLPGTGTTAGNAIEKIIRSVQSFYEINYVVIGNHDQLQLEINLPYRTFFTAGPAEDWSSIEPFSGLADILSSRETSYIGKRINALISSLSPEFVLLDIQSHTVLRSVGDINLENTKSVVLLWDHWSWRYKVFNSSKKTIDGLDDIRRSLLRKANNVLVPSEEFKEYLIQQNFTDSQNISVVYLPVKNPSSKVLPGPAARATKKSRVIGFAGQQYAAAEIQDLLDAVKHINDQSSLDYKIEIHLFSSVNFLEDQENVFYQGFFDQPTLVERLADCEVLFLPYPFDPSLQLVSELSFPSKFTDYLQALRPVIFYGPSSSPLSSLLFNRGYPFVIGARSKGSIVHVLNKALCDFELQIKSESIIEDLINSDFSLRRFQDSLNDIGLKSIHYESLQAISYSEKPVSWEHFQLSNLLARAISPAIPLLTKVRRVRSHLMPSKIVIFILQKYRTYADQRIIKYSRLNQLESVWINGEAKRKKVDNGA